MEAKNKFSEKSTTSPVLYALSFLFFSATEKVSLLFWLLTMKGCPLLKKEKREKVTKGKKGLVFKHFVHFKNKLFRFSLNTEKIV